MSLFLQESWIGTSFITVRFLVAGVVRFKKRKLSFSIGFTSGVMAQSGSEDRLPMGNEKSSISNWASVL